MADRYWVGGSGSWNSTTKWSTTSGGASGASVPTASDNAIFDANSGAAHYTVTVTDNSTCANLTFTPHASNGVTQFAVGVNFVIAGTFSTSGTQGNRRAWFRSSTYGLMRDMQVATIGTVTDVDFRDIRVTGTGGTLTGTRIGDLRGCRGITFSTPKTVYWIGGGNASNDLWAASSGGAVSTNNFPLAQDTAVIDQASTSPLNLDSNIPYTGSLDCSARTSAMTVDFSVSGFALYGNWTSGSGITISGSGTISFVGRNAQVITSAGKVFSQPINIDSYGGTVELADAFTGNTITVTNGTFDTKNFNVTGGTLASSNSNVRTITLGSSTVTLSSTVVLSTTNLTFNSGTSQLNLSLYTLGNIISAGAGLIFYDVNLTTSSPGSTPTIVGDNTFRNLAVAAPASAGLTTLVANGNQTITGTLTAAGATAVRRVMLRSNTLGTTRTLTVNSISADDCDFRDITLAGAAAGASPTRAGDCGGNTGITFPAAKTVYWNLAGTQNWSADGWATSSGGAPATNNFPLAQDTAVFDNTGAAGTVTLNAAWNIGTFDASARTSAMTLTTSTNTPTVYGDWLFGTGVTNSSTTGTITFAARGTETITSNGVTFGCPITIDCATGTVQLADALTLGSTRTLTLTSGTFDAVTYNVTTGLFSVSGSVVKTLKMGSGTWTLSGTGSVFSLANVNTTFYKGTANIVLSDTSTTARTFGGGNFSFNKLTIGGTTGTSTLTINDTNQFTELASTKTVAHTIALGSTTQTFGAWTVSGSPGNVVTVTGTGTSHVIAGSRVSGVDYLAMGSIGFAATSPGEFYAGANSTGTNATIIKTDAPTPVTRYWVGGTGTWDATTTTKWSASSGGAGGASVPTSADAVIFDSASNATAYTVTCTATQLRCGSLTISGPASGNVTWAGTGPLAIHDSVTLPASGLTRTYTGALTLTGSTAGKTLTTNGVALSATTINGIGCGWTLGDALSCGTFIVAAGSFDTANYNFSNTLFRSNTAGNRSINLGSSTVSITGNTQIDFGSTAAVFTDLSFNSGTSQINISGNTVTVNGNNQTFYNTSFTSSTIGTITINGANTFNNLSVAGTTSAGIPNISLSADQTINGTLTLSAGTDATMRTFVLSNTIGTTRTLTCAAVASLQDIDFRDITIAGAAAPVSGTRLGDGKGNTGITFDAPKTVYWRNATSANWGATSWSATDGGTADVTQFPLAQDTAIIPSGYPNSGQTVTINAAYNIGTIDMSARTSNTMTLANGSAPTIYGNWINGTGTTLTGTGPMAFAGRGSQTITSAGRSFTQSITINTPGGSVTLQDAFTSGNNISHDLGTLNTNGFSVTLSSLTLSQTNLARTLALGSSTLTLTGGFTYSASVIPSIFTGTGTISLTSGSPKTFAGGGISYSGITLNQGGAGTLTISGNNTFKDITNTYGSTGATTIAMGTTTQTVQQWTGAGTTGKLLTIQGSSATNPCTLILTGAVKPNVDYLTITGVRAYSLDATWYAGNNSLNNGSLGWYFEAGGAPASSIYWGAVNIASIYYGSTPVTSIYYGSTKVFG